MVRRRKKIIPELTMQGGKAWKMLILRADTCPYRYVEVISEPTGNCQTFTIDHIINLMECLTKSEFKTVLKKIFSKINKKLLLADIECHNKEYFEKFFKDCEILVKCDFINTYEEHPMCMYLINIEDIVE